MLIQNFDSLAKNENKKTVLLILEEGLCAAMPESAIKKFVNHNTIKISKNTISLSKYENVFCVAFGKAADSMTQAISKLAEIKKGIIVMPKDSKSVVTSKKFQIINSGHPVPDKSSVKAAKTILKFLQKRKKNELVIFLVSGGASSLLALPDGISLQEKILTTNQLLKSGATIHEINCIRKHLSKIKGGQLVKNLKCDSLSLVMSDVLENDLSSIASGTTYFDNTTFTDAKKIIKKYNLETKLPKKVLDRIRYGTLGKIPETPKKPKIKHKIIATNDVCLGAMAKKAKSLGLDVRKVTISDNVHNAASRLYSLIPKKNNSCIIFGGETTVNVTGTGKGGRNQELALLLLHKMQKAKQNLVVASIGTDGIDGNTKYAGAITDFIHTPQSEISDYLKHNDSQSFFKKHNCLIKTGRTHTNLMDIGIILKCK